MPGSEPTNVFILNTGRCGSVTFIKACRHITNYTSAHESRWSCLGQERLRYPANHIEADNRLSWFLGRLDQKFGNQAFYVHLKRDRLKTAQSFVGRYHRGVIGAFRKIVGGSARLDPLQVCIDYCETVDTNIELFLRDKTQKLTFECEKAAQDFPRFWSLIGARGDLEAACAEWNIRHNASKLDSVWRRLAKRVRLRI